MNTKKYLKDNLLFIAGILCLTVLISILHVRVPFMMDDMWYSTNLATNEPLENFGDVIESQIWHFLHWGGRNITHGILQLTLMAGDFIANTINILTTLLLVWMICVLAKSKKPLFVFLAFTMLLACNPNIRMSMFWQAGCANYVYSTAWIFIFLWAYLRETAEHEVSKLPLIDLWILPLGLMTGWSNENMGPASFCIALAIVVYLWRIRNRSPRIWMILGILSSFIGSGFAILAPGNFARSSALPDVGILHTLYERTMNMLCAGTDYLFPSAIIMIAVLLVYRCYFKEKIQPFQWFLLAHIVLSYGAMVLSPHYPDRATFGTMCVCIVVTISALSRITENKKEYHTGISLLSGCLFLYCLYLLFYTINTLAYA